MRHPRRQIMELHHLGLTPVLPLQAIRAQVSMSRLLHQSSTGRSKSRVFEQPIAFECRIMPPRTIW
eukprot:scaffold9357_cov267-Chaetoceros_neogracile.AAC.11